MMGGIIFKNNEEYISRTSDCNNTKSFMYLEQTLTGNIKLPTNNGFTAYEFKG